MTLHFDCGCVYRSRVGLLFTRIREEGNYRVAEGAIRFTRPSGEGTAWPYRFEGDRLVIEEEPGEVYAYERIAEGSCR